MKLSIIIPVMNQLHWTQHIYKEITTQIHSEDFEVIWINNNSIDGTKEWLDELLTNPKTVGIHKVWHFKTNMGVNPAWNFGISMANGEYCLVINNDINMADGLDTFLIEQYVPGKINCPMTQREDGTLWYQRNNINGACWMIKKSDYKDQIDSRLLIWYGDDWLLHHYGVQWHPISIVHHGSQTIGKAIGINKLIKEDEENWKVIIRERGWTDERYPLITL